MRRSHRWGLSAFVLTLVLVGLARSSLAQQDGSLKISLADANITLLGEDNGDWAGYFASPGGDVNGDGLGDVLVGAPMAGNKVCPYPVEPGEQCPGLPKGEGVAYLVLGRPQEEGLPNPMDLAQADASFLGCEVNSMTARQLYTAGNVNGDSYDDIIISGWKCGESYTGKAYLFLGRSDVDSWGHDFPVEQADASFLGENEWDFLSYYVSTAGDVNADGYDDLLITSTHYDITGTQVITNAGKAYLILGRQAANWGRDYPLALADASFLGEAEEDRIGRSATGVGDVNGDGYDDFVISSISSDYGGVDGGQSYLFLGRATQDDARYDPARPWWGQGYSVAGADASFVGEAAGDESGRRVAKAGDVNEDGYGDFLIGAALNDQAALDAGIAHLILGRAAADWGMHYPLVEADASFIGEEEKDPAGYDVAWLNDFDGDGIDDYLIAAYGGRNNDGVPGETYVLLGTEEPLPTEFVPDVPRNYLGWRRFTGNYLDPSGWQDISTAQLVLGRGATDPTGLNVKYEAGENALYLYDNDESRWLGPCTPGEERILSNDVIQLDCWGSSTEGRKLWTLRVMWRVRWLQPVDGSSELHAYLRGVDLSANDSGFVEFQWNEDVAVMKEISPAVGILPRGLITYTLAFGNAGGAFATNVVVSDVMPIELTDVYITSTYPLTASGGTSYTWRAGDLGPMQGGVITISGLVSPGLSRGYAFTNTAIIDATQPDDDRNNSASVQAVVSYPTYLPCVLK